jgi:ATP-binding cassette subfamily B protein
MSGQSPMVTALRLGYRADRRLALGAVALTVVEHAADATPALLLKMVVDAIVAGDRSRTSALAVLLAVAYIVGSVARNANVSISGKLIDRTGHLVTRELLDLAGGTPTIEHFENPTYLDRVTLLRQDRGEIARFGGSVITALGLAVRVALTVVLLASVHPILLALPIFAVPSLFTGGRARRATLRAQERLASPRRLAPHYLALALDPVLARELRIFGLGDIAVSRNRRANAELRAEEVRADARASAITAIGTLTFTLGYLAAIAVVVKLAADGQATAGDLALAVVLGAQVNGLTARTVGFVTDTISASTAVARYEWLIDYAREHRSAATVDAPGRLSKGIHFDHVTFRYPGADEDVLHDVTVDLAAGSTVAIVGENGAGKSTLAKLLLGFYAPTVGHVVVDNVPLADIDPDGWRSATTAAFQDFVRYELLLRESVGVGDVAAMDDPTRIEDALRRGHGEDIAELLPHGVDTQLGRRWSGGTDLSGGQWQKTALARTLMRNTPLLLVFDEPTSALDPHSEHALFEDYAAAGKAAGAERGAITVLISHRFSTVRMADTVIVLADGRVAEVGTHDELIHLGGTYAELFAIQARAYR